MPRRPGEWQARRAAASSSTGTACSLTSCSARWTCSAPPPPRTGPAAVPGEPRKGGHMCLGIPGEVVEFVADQPDLAKVDVSGVRRVINIGLLADDPPRPGEWVLIHVGFALSKIDEDEAAAALQFLEGIGQAYEEELAALQESMIE